MAESSRITLSRVISGVGTVWVVESCSQRIDAICLPERLEKSGSFSVLSWSGTLQGFQVTVPLTVISNV